MYHQALDSSAQTTTATAQMPRPFVRGYQRQAVSRIQGGGYEGYTEENVRQAPFKNPLNRLTIFQELEKGYPQSDQEWYSNFILKKGGKPPTYPKKPFVFNDKKK